MDLLNGKLNGKEKVIKWWKTKSNSVEREDYMVYKEEIKWYKKARLESAGKGN